MGIVFLVLFWCLVHEPAALEKLLFSFGDSLTGAQYPCLKVQLGHIVVMGHHKSPTVTLPRFSALEGPRHSTASDNSGSKATEPLIR